MIAVASRLPWWVSLITAVVLYVTLHRVATAAIPAPKDLQGLSASMGPNLWKVLATFGQYVLPLAFCIGAIVSAITTRRSKTRYAQTAAIGRQSALLDMTWQQFESLVGEHFRQQGFEVRLTGQNGADGGVDIELRRGAELCLVQCKQWRAIRVGVAVVRELYGAMAAQGAASAIVVSAGQFTADAEEFVKGRNIRLLNGEQLTAGMKSKAAPAREKPETFSRLTALTEKTCPKCGEPMALRTARQGLNAGGRFWGCTSYPKCKATTSA